MHTYKLKRWWICAVFPIGFLLTLLFKQFPQLTEQVFSRGIYRVLSHVLNWITGLLPFSLAQWLLIAFVLGAVAYLVYGVVTVVRHKGERKWRAYRWAVNLLCALAVLYGAFLLLCGFNYYRVPFYKQAGLTIQESSVEELYGTTQILLNQVNEYRAQVGEDELGVMALSGDSGQTAQQAKEAFNALEEEYPVLYGGYSQPKEVFFSRAMSYMNISGMFFPFTAEANVNRDIPDYEIPYTYCHELMHLRGFMREDEANFAAFLACIGSDSVDLHYSGALMALNYCMNALYSADRELYAQIAGQLCDGAWRDMQYGSEYWRQFEGPIAQVSTSVNDAYLKANDQQHGVQSYGLVVDLLIAYYRV